MIDAIPAQHMLASLDLDRFIGDGVAYLAVQMFQVWRG
jgi:hypothetical protein